jgi:predicted dehydrogenase
VAPPPDPAAPPDSARETRTPPARPVRFGIVGRGWRADFYLRLTRQLPEHFACTGIVTRTAEARAALEREWGVPAFGDVPSLVAGTSPEVVVTSVAPSANASVLRSVVEQDVAVLAETPPGTDVEELRRLWAGVGTAELVQVAEQHPFLPAVVALRELVKRGVLGQPCAAQVSWTHGYHAMALLRCLLGMAASRSTVHASGAAPIIEGPDRAGRPAAPALLQPPATRRALLEAAAGSACLRLHRRPVVPPAASPPRRLAARQPRRGGRDLRPLVRARTACPHAARSSADSSASTATWMGADLDTLSWAGQLLYRNPYRGARMSDEELAVATCLDRRRAAWRRGEAPAPYPLADACQDQLLALAVDAAVETGTVQRTSVEPWAEHVRSTF